MGVYIKGIEMPTEGTVITIYKLKGKFYASVHGTELCPIVPVPSHGRLIDANALTIELMDRGVDQIQFDDLSEIQQAIADAPTIIEAEENEE